MLRSPSHVPQAAWYSGHPLGRWKRGDKKETLKVLVDWATKVGLVNLLTAALVENATDEDRSGLMALAWPLQACQQSGWLPSFSKHVAAVARQTCSLATILWLVDACLRQARLNGPDVLVKNELPLSCCLHHFATTCSHLRRQQQLAWSRMQLRHRCSHCSFRTRKSLYQRHAEIRPRSLVAEISA